MIILSYKILKSNSTNYSFTTKNFIRVLISFKYRDNCNHCDIDGIEFKEIYIDKKDKILICKTDYHIFKQFLKILDFLPKIQQFLFQVCNNKFFVDKTLTIEETKNELQYKKYIIFPEGQDVQVVKMNNNNDILRMQLGINWEKCSLFILNDKDKKNMVPIKSLNQFLVGKKFIKFLFFFFIFHNSFFFFFHFFIILSFFFFDSSFSDFLTIKTKDKIELLSWFGYHPADLFEESDRTPVRATQNKLGEFVSSREKTEVVRQLDLDIMYSKSPNFTLEQILNTIKDGNLKVKMEWIHCDLVRVLVHMICRSNTQSETLPIKILGLLCKGNSKGCLVVCESLASHINTHFQCISVFYTLKYLISSLTFKKIIFENMGISVLLDFYEKASIILHQTKFVERRLGSIDYKPDLVTLEKIPEKKVQNEKISFIDSLFKTSNPEKIPSSESKDIIPLSTANPEKEKTDLGGKKVPLLNFSQSPPVGKQSIPTLKIDGLSIPTERELNTLTYTERYYENHGSASRRTRRIQGGEFHSPKKELILGRDSNFDGLNIRITPGGELKQLAKQLGGTFMASDLTALLSLKNASQLARDGNRAKIFEKKDKKSINKNFEQFRNQPCYIIKFYILEMIKELTVPTVGHYKFKIPVNLLFSELVVTFEDKILSNDKLFKNQLFSVLENFSDEVELFHRKGWKNLNTLSVSSKENLRKKMDVFIWRLKGRLVSLYSSRSTKDLSLFLSILYEYMAHCPSRVLASNVVDVCLEIILKIQHFAFSRKVSYNDIDMIPIVHQLFGIYSELISNNNFPPLNKMLLNLLFKVEDTEKYFRLYTSQVIKNSKVQKTILSTENGKKLLKQYRARAVEYYIVKIYFNFLLFYLTCFPAEMQ